MSTRTVLVADDSPVIRKLVGICLRGMDLDLAEAEDGIAAVEVAITTRPDVMLLDVGLPGKDGWTVLRDLRADPATVDLPIVMLTGHAADADRRKAEALGISGFMTKPFQPAELRATIARLLPVDDAVPMHGSS